MEPAPWHRLPPAYTDGLEGMDHCGRAAQVEGLWDLQVRRAVAVNSIRLCSFRHDPTGAWG